ncbi:MAG: UDP-N-acetylglucosamine 1-carboxyvinyltransferase [Acidimicrobiia bacterium]
MRDVHEIVVAGGRPIEGIVSVSGAKNAVLKHMVASVLAPGTHVLRNVPAIADVELMVEVLTYVGATCTTEGDVLTIVMPEVVRPEAPLDLVRRFRASILVLGPLLARCGVARVAFPGGDELGARPIDMHIDGLRRMGAMFSLAHGVLTGNVEGRLRGAEIDLEFPSVGATENLMLAAATTDGETLIHNAAREPEIQDLAKLLSEMGARIEGTGTATVRIEGVTELVPADHEVIPDRLEAGTYAAAAAITGGTVTVKDCVPADLRMELHKLAEAGCEISRGDDAFEVTGPNRPIAVDVATLPFPGFHTDMQPQMVSLLSVADGTSIITENLYDARFRYVGELARMGADITIEGQHAVVRGVERLSGCPVEAPDIRAGAALVLAGLRADGYTRVGEIHHIDRGYGDLVGKLRSLGAEVSRAERVD